MPSRKALCTTPVIGAKGAWAGTNCADGATNVLEGTDCQITAASEHVCVNPGVCQADKTFAAQATMGCKALQSFFHIFYPPFPPRLTKDHLEFS